MGASASIRPEIFVQVKEFYEQKKTEGLSDEELFNAIKNFIDTANEALDKPEAASTVAEETSETVANGAAPTEAAPAATEEGVGTPQVFAG